MHIYIYILITQVPDQTRKPSDQPNSQATERETDLQSRAPTYAWVSRTYARLLACQTARTYGWHVHVKNLQGSACSNRSTLTSRTSAGHLGQTWF